MHNNQKNNDSKKESKTHHDAPSGHEQPPQAHHAHAPHHAPHAKAVSFQEMRLSQTTLDAITQMGYTTPTPIQQQAIPLLMQGSDIIGQAQTGTGKTAAFAIPIIEAANPQHNKLQALILVPTRELAIQVANETRQIGKNARIAVLEVYGGASMDHQVQSLRRGVQIVVATPGRLIDLLNRNAINLSTIHLAVLDEADRMLDMGFIDDVELILSKLPSNHQTALFSATMPTAITNLSRKFMHTPETISIKPTNTADKLKITQYILSVDPKEKISAVCTLLKTRAQKQTIIFCRTKKGADNLQQILRRKGFLTLPLHGDMPQNARERTMQKFRENQAQILVATDVAARGIDIDDVTHVINYNPPEDAEAYTHRIGRTGRAGKSGEAITLASNLEEIRQIEGFARATNTPINKLEIEIQHYPNVLPFQGADYETPRFNQRRQGGFNRPRTGGSGPSNYSRSPSHREPSSGSGGYRTGGSGGSSSYRTSGSTGSSSSSPSSSSHSNRNYPRRTRR